MAVAGLRDRALRALLTGGTLGRDQPDEAHELRGRLEARPVGAELGDQPERGQRVNAAQAAQPRDQLAPRARLGGRVKLALKLLDAAVDEVQRVQIGLKRLLLMGVREGQRAQPAAAGHAPRLGRHPRSCRSRNLLSRWRSRIRSRRASSRARTRSRTASTGSLGTAIASSSPPACNLASLRASRGFGFDPIAGPDRHQPGRDDIARDPARTQIPRQPVAGRAGLIAAAHPRPPRHRPRDRLRVIGHRALVQQLVRADRGQANRRGVNVQAHVYRRRRPALRHGRRPPYVALPAHPGNPRRCAGADHCPFWTGRSRSTHGSILTSAVRSALRLSGRGPDHPQA